MPKLPPPQIDLVRFGYVLFHRREALGMTQEAVRDLTGISARALSNAENGKRIGAGPTYVLCQLYDIEIEECLPPETRTQLAKIARRKADIRAEMDEEKRRKSNPLHHIATRETCDALTRGAAAPAPRRRPDRPDTSSVSVGAAPQGGERRATDAHASRPRRREAASRTAVSEGNR